MRTTKLFIDNGNGYAEVDLYDNLDIPITYNVADVQDISKKDSNFSLTVKLPNTTNNAQLFDVIHDIARYNSTFELLKQYPAIVEVDNNRTFEGYFKLTKVVINDDKEISYEGNLYSNVIEFMKRLGTTTLRGNTNAADDLSFSEYTKELTVIEDNTDPDFPGEFVERTDMFIWDTSTSPWTPIGEKPYGKDFYFAPVDRYLLANRTPVNYSLPNQHNNRNSIPLFFDELTPFLFYKEIWEKIFEWAGFSFVSDFINDNNNTTPFRFDHLVYPSTQYNTGTIHDVYSLAHNIRTGGLNETRDVVWDEVSEYLQPLISVMNNPYNAYGITDYPVGITSDSPYTFTAPRSGVYSLNINIPWKFGFKGHNISAIAPEIRFNSNFPGSVPFTCRFGLVLTRAGVSSTIAYDEIQGNYDEVIGSNAHLDNNEFILGNSIFSTQMNIQLMQGDVLTFVATPRLREYWYSFGAQQPILEYDYNGQGAWTQLYQDAVFYTLCPTELDQTLIDLRLINDFAPGGIFDPTVILNPKRRKTDFILDIVRKFNLYIEDVTDKKDANGVYYRDYPGVRVGEPILRVEPRGMFYSNDFQVKDWTQKTDVSTIEFGRIDDYVYNLLDFNDFNDETHYTKDYAEHKYSEGEFGEAIISSPFNTSDSNKTEVKTNLGQTMCITPRDRENNNLYCECPSFFKVDDNFNIKTDVEWKDRMLFVHNLYWGGKVPGVYDYDFNDIWNDSSIKQWVLFLRDNATPDQFIASLKFPLEIRTYLWLSHLNVPFGKDTADLNFYWANWYYQNLNGTNVTANNAYNTFYKQMVDEYNSPDSRIMTCNMFLSPSDIRDLKLSDTIIVNNVAYHINKIKQWKNGNTPTQVELIKELSSNSSASVTPKGPVISRPPQLPTIFQPAELITDMDEVQQELSKFGDMIQQNSGDIAKNTELVKAMEEMLKKLEERVKKLEAVNTGSGKGDSANTGTNTTSMAFSKQEKKRGVLKTSPSEPAPLSAHQQYLKSLGAKFDSPPYI